MNRHTLSRVMLEVVLVEFDVGRDCRCPSGHLYCVRLRDENLGFVWKGLGGYEWRITETVSFTPDGQAIINNVVMQEFVTRADAIKALVTLRVRKTNT